MKKISCKSIFVIAVFTANYAAQAVSSGFLRNGQQNGAAGIAPDVRIELPCPDTLTDKWTVG